MVGRDRRSARPGVELAIHVDNSLATLQIIQSVLVDRTRQQGQQQQQHKQRQADAEAAVTAAAAVERQVMAQVAIYQLKLCLTTRTPEDSHQKKGEIKFVLL